MQNNLVLGPNPFALLGGNEGFSRSTTVDSTSSQQSISIGVEAINGVREISTLHVHPVCDKYDVYRRRKESNCQYFGLICKEYDSTMFQMGDLVHDNYIFVVATTVDQSIHPDTNVSIYLTLMVHRELSNDTDVSGNEFIYETVEDFTRKCAALFDDPTSRQKVTDIDFKDKIMKFFKIEMLADKNELILNSYLHHMKKSIEIDQKEDENPEETEKEELPGPVINGESEKEEGPEKEPEQPAKSETKSRSKSKKNSDPIPSAPARPASSREAARKSIPRYSPVVETRKKVVAPPPAPPVEKKKAPPAEKKAKSKPTKSQSSSSSSNYSTQDEYDEYEDGSYLFDCYANSKSAKMSRKKIPVLDLTGTRLKSVVETSHSKRDSEEAAKNAAAMAAMQAQLDDSLRREDGYKRMCKNFEGKLAEQAQASIAATASALNAAKTNNQAPPPNPDISGGAGAAAAASSTNSLLQQLALQHLMPPASAPAASQALVPQSFGMMHAPQSHGYYYYPPPPPMYAPQPPAPTLDPNLTAVAIVALMLGRNDK